MAQRTYTGPDAGINTAWESDLSTAHKNLNMTQELAEKDGETIGGTTEDDKGDEMTVAIPAYVDRDELSDTRQKIIEQRILHPDLTQDEIGDRAGCQGGYVSMTLSEYLTEETRQKIYERRIKTRENDDGDQIVSVVGEPHEFEVDEPVDMSDTNNVEDGETVGAKPPEDFNPRNNGNANRRIQSAVDRIETMRPMVDTGTRKALQTVLDVLQPSNGDDEDEE